MINYHLYIIKYIVVVLIWVTFFIIITEKNTFARQFFNMGTPKLGLGLSYEFNNEKNTGRDISSESERHEFRERLEIETNGWIYHPAFMVYNFDFIPVFIQRTEEIDAQKGTKNTFMQGYYFNATFLPYKPFTLTLFGRKQDIPQTTTLTRASDRVIENIGATIGLKNRVLPTSLSYKQTKTEQTGFYNSQDKIDNWQLTSNHQMKKSDSYLDANYEQRVYTVSGIQSETDSLSSYFSNNYTISEDRRIRLNSYISQRLINYYDSKFSGIQFRERLDWAHRKNLNTNYSFLYVKNKSGDIFDETTNLEARLTHGLYENLTTNVSGNVDLRDFTVGSQKSYTGNLNFDYLRPTPWGSLGLNMGFNYRHRSSTFDEDFIPVINEPHILSDFDLTLLDNKFIDIESIKITNVTGTKIYIKDLDYRVQEINSFVRINRIIGGGIADGEEVLVGYRYLSDASYDDSRLSQTYGFNLNLWSTLLFFYQFQHSKQKLLSGVPPDDLENDTTHMANLELLWKFTDTIFSYENSDRAAGNSIERWSVEEVLAFRPTIQLFLRFTGNLAHWKFKKGIDEEQNIYGLGCSIDWTPRTWTKLGLAASHYVTSGETVDREDTEIRAIFEMSYFIWNGSLRYSYITQNDKIADETRQVHNIFFEIIKLNF